MRGMLSQPPLFALVIIAFAAVLQGSSALYFILNAGDRKCFTEVIPASSTVRGTVIIAHGDGDMKVDAYVQDQRNKVKTWISDTTHKHFTFQSDPPAVYKPGSGESRSLDTYEYKICFHHQVIANELRRWDVWRKASYSMSWIADDSGVIDELENAAQKGVEDLGGDRLATPEDAIVIEKSITKVNREVEDVVREVDRMRGRDRITIQSNEAAGETIQAMGIISIAAVAVAGVAQAFVLAKTFEKKNSRGGIFS